MYPEAVSGRNSVHYGDPEPDNFPAQPECDGLCNGDAHSFWWAHTQQYDLRSRRLQRELCWGCESLQRKPEFVSRIQTGSNGTQGQQFNNQVIKIGNENTDGITLNLRGPSTIYVNQGLVSSSSTSGQGNIIQVGALNLTNTTVTLGGGNLYRLRAAGPISILGSQITFQTNQNDGPSGALLYPTGKISWLRCHHKVWRRHPPWHCHFQPKQHLQRRDQYRSRVMCRSLPPQAPHLGLVQLMSFLMVPCGSRVTAVSTVPNLR